MVIFAQNGEVVTIAHTAAQQPLDLLLLAGVLFYELIVRYSSIVHYSPFVINTETEIRPAIGNYH
jgi:redox-sensitive bicupin YhaK (pirin superfamily)